MSKFRWLLAAWLLGVSSFVPLTAYLQTAVCNLRAEVSYNEYAHGLLMKQERAKLEYCCREYDKILKENTSLKNSVEKDAQK